MQTVSEVGSKGNDGVKASNNSYIRKLDGVVQIKSERGKKQKQIET